MDNSDIITGFIGSDKKPTDSPTILTSKHGEPYIIYLFNGAATIFDEKANKVVVSKAEAKALYATEDILTKLSIGTEISGN